MHSLKEQRRATSMSHVDNTFGYLRKQPVLCFANKTRVKWFSLNGSSLCIIVMPKNHQSWASWQSGQYFILWSERATAWGLLSPKKPRRFRGRHTLGGACYTQKQCSAPHHTQLFSVSLEPIPRTCVRLHLTHVAGTHPQSFIINTFATSYSSAIYARKKNSK